MSRTPNEVSVTLQANGQVQTIKGPGLTPAKIAEMKSLDVEHAVVMVNTNKAEMNAALKDGDFVHFAISKVTSGS